MSSQFLTLSRDPWVRDPDEVTAAALRRLAAPLPTEQESPPSARNSSLGDRDFFEGKSITELAREQGVTPIKDIRVFAGVIPKDDDVDDMLDEIYRLREP